LPGGAERRLARYLPRRGTAHALLCSVTGEWLAEDAGLKAGPAVSDLWPAVHGDVWQATMPDGTEH